MEAFVQTVTALRVDLARAGCPGHEVLVVTRPRASAPGFREFYRMSQESVEAVYMFGVEVSSDDEAVELALANGPEYIW